MTLEIPDKKMKKAKENCIYIYTVYKCVYISMYLYIQYIYIYVIKENMRRLF